MGILDKLFAKKTDLSESGVREMFKENPKTELLDVRTAGEYRQAHINPCNNIDLRNPDEWTSKVKYLDKDKPYVVYCQSGRRSSKALKKLQNLGFESVYQLKGGIDAWDGALRVK